MYELDKEVILTDSAIDFSKKVIAICNLSDDDYGELKKRTYKYIRQLKNTDSLYWRELQSDLRLTDTIRTLYEKYRLDYTDSDKVTVTDPFDYIFNLFREEIYKAREARLERYRSYSEKNKETYTITYNNDEQRTFGSKQETLDYLGCGPYTLASLIRGNTSKRYPFTVTKSLKFSK